MEFGLGEALPLYAGGLGILAGDFLKTASDLGLPAASPQCPSCRSGARLRRIVRGKDNAWEPMMRAK
jgi:hypothetical protein